MDIIWQVTSQDIERVQALLASQRNNPFVLSRIRSNVTDRPASISAASFWEVLIACLLSTQQRSGPDSAVSRFMRQKPFPLALATVVEQRSPQAFMEETLKQFGGIRFTNRIPDQLVVNLAHTQGDAWQVMHAELARLLPEHPAATERVVANYLATTLKGVGSKQARNLLQSLGLTQYEIPIDSRITKWLNNFGFPVKLTAGGLSDPNYYNFVSDGIQALCERCGILPCVLDAAIFASYDGDGWTNENVYW